MGKVVRGVNNSVRGVDFVTYRTPRSDAVHAAKTRRARRAVWRARRARRIFPSLDVASLVSSGFKPQRSGLPIIQQTLSFSTAITRGHARQPPGESMGYSLSGASLLQG